MDKGKGKSRRAEIVDDCCGRWRDNGGDRRRETVVVGSDGSNDDSNDDSSDKVK